MNNKEVRQMLEKAAESLDLAYKNVRIAISDLRDEDTSKLKGVLINISWAQLGIQKLLYPESIDVYEVEE